jgi:hypothetical protein
MKLVLEAASAPSRQLVGKTCNIGDKGEDGIPHTQSRRRWRH